MSRGTVLITGVGRQRSIGAGIARRLAVEGWDLVLGHWRADDERVGLDRGDDDPELIAAACRSCGARVETVCCDLAEPEAGPALVRHAARHGGLAALVLSHCESVDSAILDTTVESWDRHFAVNARASWLMIRTLAESLPARPTPDPIARVIALTSDHTSFNLPYGASKGALDRLVIAAGAELGHRGLRANLINPGPIDTGWMGDALRTDLLARTPSGRLGTPADIADLVVFLLSPGGGWINGQLLHADGGFSA